MCRYFREDQLSEANSGFCGIVSVGRREKHGEKGNFKHGSDLDFSRED
jgi:hypothetical protein